MPSLMALFKIHYLLCNLSADKSLIFSTHLVKQVICVVVVASGKMSHSCEVSLSVMITLLFEASDGLVANTLSANPSTSRKT